MRCNANKETPLGITGSHDWAQCGSSGSIADGDFKVLCFCPCGEFRWTSYAEWEAQRPDAADVQFSPLSANTVRPVEWEREKP